MHANARIVLLLQTLLHTCLLGDISLSLSLGFDPESLHISDWQVNMSKHAFWRHFCTLFSTSIIIRQKPTVTATRRYWRCSWGCRDRRLLHSAFHRYLSLLCFFLLLHNCNIFIAFIFYFFFLTARIFVPVCFVSKVLYFPVNALRMSVSITSNRLIHQVLYFSYS